MTSFHAYCRRALDDIREQGRYRTFTPLQKQAARYPYYRQPDGHEILVWSSNDYLGMGGHPVLVEAACAAAREMGAGAGGTRNISGTSPVHDALESELANLHGKQGYRLVGDPAKAHRVLGWQREVDFPGLVTMMVKADMDLVRHSLN